MENKKLNDWLDLYLDARAHKSNIDTRITRQNELYNGLAQPIDPKTGRNASRTTTCVRNMCFELIETQINNAIPQPKITPRDPDKIELAQQLEGYLQMETDRLSSEEINDEAERGVLKHGTAIYLVGWDETKSTPTTSGEVFVKYYPLERVYFQPGVDKVEDLEYIFTKDLVSIKKIKELYNVDVPDIGDFKGLATLMTVWYFNDAKNLSKYGWIENTDVVVFDYEAYELRRLKVCKECGEKLMNLDICPVCGSKKYEYKILENETLNDDIIRGDPETGVSEVFIKKGTEIPFYSLKQLPFVFRKNISLEGSLYGLSDIDLLENGQITLNKITSKMEQNILKAGSIVTVPKGVNIPNTDETLKIVTLKDPNSIKAFTVQTTQANMQQDNILQEQIYQMGRESLGITDSYQGKRDTTAESGKAKQVSAAQAAGRMESKRRMKDAAYADLYKLIFKFLLAYCDEKRTFSMLKSDGSYVQGSFSRYNYLDKNEETGEIYYNDRFLFSVDTASTLLNNREALWNETVSNFTAGSFGNPQDPQTLMLFWNMMKGLNYPLAKFALANLRERSQQLPYELQQVIMQNPKILEGVKTLIQNPEILEGGK